MLEFYILFYACTKRFTMPLNYGNLQELYPEITLNL